jgi:hypothetical protein
MLKDYINARDRCEPNWNFFLGKRKNCSSTSKPRTPPLKGIEDGAPEVQNRSKAGAPGRVFLLAFMCVTHPVEVP